MAILFQSFWQPLNGTRAQVVADINTFLTANPAIVILNVAMSRTVDSRKSDKLRIRIMYDTTAGVTYSANLVTSTSAAFAAFALANPTFYTLHMLDVSERDARSLDPGAVLIFGTTNPIHPGNQVLIAEANAAIAAGGTTTGAAKIYDSNATLLSASTTVTNGSALFAWPMGQRNLVIFDPDTHRLIGIPSCSGTGNPIP